MENLTKAREKELRHKERIEFEVKMKNQASMERIKKIGLWIGGIIVLAASVWGLMLLVNTPSPTNDSASAVALDLPNDTTTSMIFGAKNAKVKLVEYADFQCPACGAYHPIVKKILNDFSGKISLEYRFFPLTNIHKNAFLSAQFAYGAYLQNKFWEMHDMLFEHQSDWAESDNAESIFTDYAKKLGLDIAKLKIDVASSATKSVIDTQMNTGLNAGINSTPTFFINGKSITNPGSYDEFKKIIQGKIK